MHVSSFLPRNILEIKCPIANFYNISCRQRIFNGCRHVFHQIARYYYYSSASFPADDKNANAFVHAVVRHYFQCRSCHRQNHSINCPFDWHVLSKRHATLRCFKFQSSIVETPTNVKNGFFFPSKYRVVQSDSMFEKFCSLTKLCTCNLSTIRSFGHSILSKPNSLLVCQKNYLFTRFFGQLSKEDTADYMQSIFQNTNTFVLQLINSLLI